MNRFQPKSRFNIHTVRAWKQNEKGAPLFDEEKYQVAKCVVFQVKALKTAQLSKLV